MFIVPISGLQSMTETQTMQSMRSINEVNNNKQREKETNTGFTKIFEEAYQNARDMQAISNQDAVDLALGNVDNLSEVMINSAKSSTATALAVDLTSRAVSTYKEILQMSI